jgi:hypothetical protein
MISFFLIWGLLSRVEVSTLFFNGSVTEVCGFLIFL